MNFPIQAQPVARNTMAAYTDAQIAQSGCNVFSCGWALLKCAIPCGMGIALPACISCLGSSYNECKDCF
jgi:hypothetical protein